MKKTKKQTKQDTLKSEITSLIGNSWSAAGDKSKSILAQSLERIENLEKQIEAISNKDSSDVDSLFNNKMKSLEDINVKLLSEIKELKSRFGKWKDLSMMPSFYLNENQKKFLKQS